MTRRALLSVTDKTGIVEFAKDLVELGFALLSTGGTYRAIREGGVPVDEVADYTGFPELMDGRLKTLHPRVHGGILARRGIPTDAESMAAHGIDPIDVVAVNLYAFRATVARDDATREEIIESIDIGGPAMLRSAAKNHLFVTVVTDPADYGRVIDALRKNDGVCLPAARRELAAKAFAHTAAYDTAIANWFSRGDAASDPPRLGAWLGVTGEKLYDLRYGENPHQTAAFYRDLDASGPGLAGALQMGGKELSYNNILDLDAAIGLASEFDAPACVIVKHNNPCGTATAVDGATAFGAALAADPISAFGGIVAFNVPIDRAVAAAMADEAGFLEAIVAPEVDPDVLALFEKARWGKSVRLLELGGVPRRDGRVLLRQVRGGFLVQTDRPGLLEADMRCVTRVQPTPPQVEGARFAMRVCKHVKSNAIVIAAPVADGVFATCGVGAGQMSRVDSVKIAVEKAGPRARGAVLASDAFFPFADGLEAAAAAGIAAVIQPGGSKRDGEVIAAADAAGIAMVFTGVRHFRH